MKPLQYFYYLRNVHGYSTRNAWICTLMRYAVDYADMQRRAIKANKRNLLRMAKLVNLAC